MSYRIEYQWASWRLTAGPDTGGVDRFVIAIEGGDNNLRDAVTGKRARSWEVCMLGSAERPVHSRNGEKSVSRSK